MKIKVVVIDVEWSSRTKRWAIRLGVPLAVLLGAAAVAYANVPHTFKDGDVLKSLDLNENFNALEQRIAALETISPPASVDPPCPLGYLQNPNGGGSIVVCSKGTDEVVKVGHGGGAFWIDRYEASVWSDAAGMGTQYGTTTNDYPASFPSNGQMGDTANALYAVSKGNVLPSISMTWFQANLACLSNGKRLATGPEWIQAATGTKDPGANDGGPGACRTSPGERRMTGAANVDTGCSSIWGAQDMIGNVWEYTSEWFAAPTSVSNWVYVPWPTAPLNGDGVWNVASKALVTDANWASGVPSVAIRGGSLGNLTLAGVFTFSVTQSPLAIDATVGFRCVVPR
ncbi:MAG TPA: SUMF1/EgtB/PvdO family nonheme iron enzyme [Polyangium sp.]|nr:SUMF1/EgtB/PvdO family nonheme iron enzyme [Polyangium sp.]